MYRCYDALDDTKRMLLASLLLYKEDQAITVWMGILRYSKFCDIYKCRIKFILFAASFVQIKINRIYSVCVCVCVCQATLSFLTII